MMLCCPITSKVKGYPFEVPVTGTATHTEGVVLSDQIRCLDWKARKAKKKARVSAQVVRETLDKLSTLLR